MLARPLSPGERMTDVFDRASTLNFATVATVRGPLSAFQLERALRRLAQRHPLLTARIARDGEEWSFVPGEAAPIPLLQQHGDVQAITPLLDASLCHREWLDAGPRGELTWLRHGADHSTVLLSLHHTVSDGSSGIIAMRDLLAFVDHPEDVPVEEQPAPGQHELFPQPLFDTLRERFMASLSQPPRAVDPTFHRLRTADDVAHEQRRAKTTRIQLDAEQSQRIVSEARRSGATVHGVLCAALSLAIAEEVGAQHHQRIAHPVSLRSYLKDKFPEQPAVGDAVGYYVSSVQTDVVLDAQREIHALARELSLAVRAKKDEHEPLLSAPIRGPLVAQRAHKMGLDAFRTWAEQKVFTATYALSNLGVLEKLGVQQRGGSLEIEDLHFAIAGSVMAAFSAAAVSFAGQISMHLTHVEPLVADDVVKRVAQRVRDRLGAL